MERKQLTMSALGAAALSLVALGAQAAPMQGKRDPIKRRTGGAPLLGREWRSLLQSREQGVQQRLSRAQYP